MKLKQWTALLACALLAAGFAPYEGIFEDKPGAAATPESSTQPATAPATVPPVPEPPMSIVERIRTALRPAVCQVNVYDDAGHRVGHGTGFAITADGFIVTNAHVVDEAASARINFPDLGIEGEAVLWQVWADRDVALLRYEVKPGTELPRLRLADRAPADAEEVWALGFPVSVELGFTVTKGIVNGVRDHAAIASIVGRAADEYSLDSQWVQIDCSLNPGNSGGPLVNNAGEVVGINTWKFTGGEGMNFASLAMDAAGLIRTRSATAAGFQVRDGSARRGLPPRAYVPGPSASGGVRAKPARTFPTTLPAAFPPTFSRLDPPRERGNLPLARRMLADVSLIKLQLCSGCGGAGKIEKKAQTGWSGSSRSGSIRTPVYRHWSEPCGPCQRTGRVRPKLEGTQKRIETAAELTCAIDAGAVASSQDFRALLDQWRRFPELPVMTLGEVTRWSSARIAAKQPMLGKGIIVQGTVLAERTDDAGIVCQLIQASDIGDPVVAFGTHLAAPVEVGSRVMLVARIGETAKVDDLKYRSVHGGVLVPLIDE